MRSFLQRLFCFHKGWSKVDEQGYQYCGECGIAIQAPAPPPPPECRHLKKAVVESLKTTSRISGNVTKITYILRCEECGTLINHHVLPMEGTGNLFANVTEG